MMKQGNSLTKKKSPHHAGASSFRLGEFQDQELFTTALIIHSKTSVPSFPLCSNNYHRGKEDTEIKASELDVC